MNYRQITRLIALIENRTNIPFERSPIELVDALCKELSAYTVDELKNILDKI